MKKIIAVALSVCIIICFSRCSQKPTQELPSSNPDSVKKAIIALNDELFSSMGNPEKYQTYCEDSMLTAADGEIATSSNFLSHNLYQRYIAPHDYTFRLFGNTAILSYLNTSYELVGKDTIFHSLRILKTFAFNNGKWKVAGFAAGNVPVSYFKPVSDKHIKDYRSYVGYYQYKPGEVDTIFLKDGKLYDKSGSDAPQWNFPVNDNEYMTRNDVTGLSDLTRLSFGKDSNGVVAYYTITNYDGQHWKCPKIK
jgi:hypothetical protein